MTDKRAVWDYDFVVARRGSKRLYALDDADVSLCLTPLSTQAQWRTRWIGGDMDDILAQVAETQTRLMTPVSRRKGERIYPCWLDVIQTPNNATINIREDCNMTVTVNIYEGCCPDGGTGSGNPPPPGGGNVADTPIGSSASKCDVVTSLVPYFNQQAVEFLTNVDLALESGSTIFDAIIGGGVDIFDPTDMLPNAIETLGEYLALALEPLINALTDDDLLLKVQQNWWGRTTSNRFDKWERADSVNLGASYPVGFGSVLAGQFVSPRAFTEIFFRYAGLNDATVRLMLARGDADDLLCEYLAAQNGETYNPSPAIPPPPRSSITFDHNGQAYTLTNMGISQTVTPPEFEIVLGSFPARPAIGAVYELNVTGTYGNCPAGSDRVWFEQNGMTTRYFSPGNLNNILEGAQWQSSLPLGLLPPVEDAMGVTMTSNEVNSDNVNVSRCVTDISCGNAGAQIEYVSVWLLTQN